jgi:hypothetical protein
LFQIPKYFSPLFQALFHGLFSFEYHLIRPARRRLVVYAGQCNGDKAGKGAATALAVFPSDK